MRRGDWYSVGDVAYRDAEGFVYICDRKRDMIISGGVNIYPAEIEDALHRHPKIRMAVFGVPDDEWGERVHAAVQVRPGETTRYRRSAQLLPAACGRLRVPRGVLPRGAAAGQRREAGQARAPRAVLGRPRVASHNRAPRGCRPP
jgi:fatty-acyl-CoA synthase/long-chain acyl-CoA synthetase